MTSSGRRNGSTNNNKEMIRNETLQSALECVVNRQLGKAVNLLENYLYTFVQPQATEQLEELKTDYQLMAEYWQRGFEDPERERLYDKLLQRLRPDEGGKERLVAKCNPTGHGVVCN